MSTCTHTFEQATDGAPHYVVRIAAQRDAEGRCPLTGLDRDECEVVARCTEHPAFEADYCPTCGTARQIGGNR